jgi:hypothetical protein
MEYITGTTIMVRTSEGKSEHDGRRHRHEKRILEQRNHAKHGCYCDQKHGPQPAHACIDYRGIGRLTQVALRINLVYQDD